MPFTPLHLGPAAVLKAALGRHFSFLVFGGTQVLMDIEPLVRMVRGDSVLHGPTHTFAGATAIALLACAIGRPISHFALKLWNLRHDAASPWRARQLPIAWHAVVIAAFAGAWSHVLLDGFMHFDMQPLAPWRADNPWLHAIGTDTLHMVCFATAAVGSAACLLLARLRRP